MGGRRRTSRRRSACTNRRSKGRRVKTKGTRTRSSCRSGKPSRKVKATSHRLRCNCSNKSMPRTCKIRVWLLFPLRACTRGRKRRCRSSRPRAWTIRRIKKDYNWSQMDSIKIWRASCRKRPSSARAARASLFGRQSAYAQKIGRRRRAKTHTLDRWPSVPRFQEI